MQCLQFNSSLLSLVLANLTDCPSLLGCVVVDLLRNSMGSYWSFQGVPGGMALFAIIIGWYRFSRVVNHNPCLVLVHSHSIQLFGGHLSCLIKISVPATNTLESADWEFDWLSICHGFNRWDFHVVYGLFGCAHSAISSQNPSNQQCQWVHNRVKLSSQWILISVQDTADRWLYEVFVRSTVIRLVVIALSGLFVWNIQYLRLQINGQ